MISMYSILQLNENDVYIYGQHRYQIYKKQINRYLIISRNIICDFIFTYIKTKVLYSKKRFLVR